MRHLASIAVLVLAALPVQLRAQGSPVVVELYTSQGCSSCPPADRFLNELAGRPGVIALALHVDYWDYLGWKDAFGSPVFSERQRGYAKAHGKRSVFTPQMIVQGTNVIVGSKVGQVNSSIAEHAGIPAPVHLGVERDGGTLVVALAAAGGEAGPADVHVVEFRPSATIAIEGGENAGQRITYSNIVTDWSTVGRWDGVAEAEFRTEVEDGPVAVIVQRAELGPVLTAAQLP